MTRDERGLLEQIEATYPSLDGWHARSEREPEEPQTGSELFKDDLVLPAHPISEMARLSLALSVEHMRFVRVVLDARQLFPSAPFTTLRGALVGAAQAVWILGPNDPDTRRERGLTVIAEEHDQLAKFYRQADELDPGTIPGEQWSWLNARIRTIKQLRGPNSPRLNQTEMIAAALDTAYPSSPEKRKQGRLLWRMMSADAHVLGWAVAQRTHQVAAPGKGQTLSVLAAPGALRHLADPFLCSFGLARCGWSLFDRRCEAT